MLQLLIKQQNFTFQRTTTITTTLSTGLYPDDLGQPVLEKKNFHLHTSCYCDYYVTSYFLRFTASALHNYRVQRSFSTTSLEFSLTDLQFYTFHFIIHAFHTITVILSQNMHIDISLFCCDTIIKSSVPNLSHFKHIFKCFHCNH